MIHGYCIRRATDPEPPEGLLGIAGLPVRTVVEGDLSMWISDGSVPQPTAADLRDHEHVVRTALQSATPLPLQFGSVLPGEVEVRAVLRDRREGMTQLLNDLAETVELSIRVSAVDPPNTAVARSAAALPPGRAYLERRKQQFDSEASSRALAEDRLKQVGELFGDLVRQTALHPAPRDERLGSVAHLVQNDRVRAYRARFDEARKAFPDLDLVVSGPWAPYSFV